jgi:acetyl-CoA carboxylase carboxyl transferase subunit beta
VTDTLSVEAVGTADWVACSRCREILYVKRLARSLGVCPSCGHHGRLTAWHRIQTLLDAGSAAELMLDAGDGGDPLGFADSKPYPRRLAEARAATGLDEAVVCVRGTIGGNPLIAAVMDFRFMGGSLGAVVGELITQAAELALRERVPFLIVTASGGARMQEGVISLMQMAKTSRALGELDEAGILTISLITDPTFGGVAASFASLCDVIVAEPGARFGFAGRRVIEQTIKEQLPADFQTAEFLLAHGMIDLVRARAELRPTMARLLSAGARRAGLPPAHALADPLIRDWRVLPEQDAWTVVTDARDLRRPTTIDYLTGILEMYEELHGDRQTGDCTAITGGLGRLDGMPIMVIGHQKGHTAAELAARNFGMPMPAGYRKAARLMRLADKLGLPVVTLIDTPGAFPGREAEEHGQAVAIAENLRLMAGLTVPILSVVIGEGGSGGALALSVANQVLACSRSFYSVISPEGCAAILWNDRAAAPLAAQALRLGARDLLRLKIVDAVIPEPEGGTQQAPATAIERLHAAIAVCLRELTEMDAAKIVEQRHRRFRAFTA